MKMPLITAVLIYGRTTCDKDAVGSTQILRHFQLLSHLTVASDS